MPRHKPYFWKHVPFLRLIIPLAAGIIIQFQHPLRLSFLSIVAAVIILLSIIFGLLRLSEKYRFRWLPGIVIHLALAFIGARLVYNQDVRNQSNWIGQFATDTTAILATLQEPLVEKAKTYKAEASVDALEVNGKWRSTRGNVLMYFSKENVESLKYGSRVLFSKPLQPIRNSGNPGGFDYKQYNAFKGIFHQVFLKTGEYAPTNTSNENGLKSWLLEIRSWVVGKLQHFIKSQREAGVAEALLIGYRDDLDKDLVQAYSNTGVVHIIAISGLHLGMIYLSLVWLLKPFKRKKSMRWFKPLFILTVLWIFTLLAGAVPSILRSAVMFTFIVLGETLNRKSSIYNTLAASAFVMLCINPYYLFDVGFQLSYAAVISIIIFSKPVYNWFYLQNRIADFFWNLTSVTIAAQVLTVPIVFYTFHQFPTLFLLTNIVVVPLSSIVLFAELILLLTSFVSPVGNLVGLFVSSTLGLMNRFIEGADNLPFAVYEGVQNSLAQTIILYVFIIAVSYWLLNKSKPALFTALATMLVFTISDAIDTLTRRRQEKLIVYNIPKSTAIDFIAGRRYAFSGDTALPEDGFLNNFHLKPSRTFHGVAPTENLAGFYISHPFVQFAGKRILVLDKAYKFDSPYKISVDVIVLSHNPRIRITTLAATFDCKHYVFDGSNSQWKINQWKKDCESLHLRHYSTSDSGAYQMNL